DNSILELVEGEEIWHPCLWEKNANPDVSFDKEFNQDSAGIYYTSDIPYYGLELRMKMERFWKNLEQITAVVLGSSRAMFGIYENGILSETLVNMAFSSGDIYGMCYLANNYVLNLLPNLKYLIIELSIDFMWVSWNSSWGPIYEGVPGYKYDENHNFWKDSVNEKFVSLVENSPKPVSLLKDLYGTDDFQLKTKGWGDVQIYRDSTLYTTEDPIFQNNKKAYTDIISLANNMGVQVIVFIPPVHPGYAKTGVYSLYGVKRSIAKSIIDEFKELNVILFDENKMGLHDYNNDMAYNVDHLSEKGSAVLTERLDSLLKSIK
ncbi:MAG: TIGR02171 family protein, partial [Bacilli bacterium]|nr:TIGR02171 family protein [Bacilli bacterium]